MPQIEITRIQNEIFGNVIKMTNSIVELHVTVDFGPRVIHFSRVGMENMLFQDKEKKPLGDVLPEFGGDVLRLYGGHRIWAAPEILPRCYHPDNQPVTTKEVEDGMEFAAAVEPFTNIQKIMTITLLEDEPIVNIEHTIKNCGAWDIELAPWCITMLAAGGKEVVPQANGDTGFLPNRQITLWPYTEMNDPRVYFGKDYIILTQDPTIEKPFKFGTNNEQGWAAYFNKGQLFFKLFEPSIDALYPDNGCSFETYTNAVMLESETLGEMVCIAPNGYVIHEETWHLYEEATIPSNDEAEIAEILEQYL